jgi:signal peptidase I
VSLPPTTLEVDESPPPVSKRRSRQKSLIEWAIVIAVAVLVSLLIRTFAFQTFYIPSGSMEPTLQVGDRIIVDKLAVEFGTIHTGDILVFKAPKEVATVCGDDVADLVKRVIATPGQTVKSVGNKIYVKDQGLSEPWHVLKQPWSHVAEVGAKPIATTYVTANHYFMVGDNEPDSCDSRYWGLLPRSDVIGKAFVRIWPLRRAGFL